MFKMVEKETAFDSARTSVMLHAFQDMGNGDREYCDPDENFPDGFNVWVRVETPNDPLQPFDIVDDFEMTFKTFGEAWRYAEGLAELFGCDVENY